MITQVLVLAAALLVLAGGFSFVEHFWPSAPGQRRRRPGLGTDVSWFFWNALANRPISSAAVILVAVLAAMIAGQATDAESVRAWLTRDTAIGWQPAWLQALELIVLLDIVGYWSHRGFHELSLLWRFHAVHHSSMQLDWLSSVRVHPLNEVGQRTAQALPLLLLGFDAALLAAFVPLLTVYAIGLHANVSWDFGRLRYVIASPRFHRWHHTTEMDGLDRNFAGLFPWVDALFGTLFLPKDRVPVEFGIVEGRVPDGLFRQLFYPFRRRPA
jgi:sterol desaturase/sphingolipid hydroxylase (fatty acid hydroxylase superfamily)